jgi:PUA domain protein
MTQRYKRYFLKERDAKAVLKEVSGKLHTDLEDIFKPKLNIEIVETEHAEVYLLNGRPLLAKVNGKIFPTLMFNEFFSSAPKVVVDMGAVPHVCNGADVMAPGIVSFNGEFREGDLVVVVDEKHKKSIAVGEILYDTDTAKSVKHGVVVKNIHFIGDKIWNFIKKLAEN